MFAAPGGGPRGGGEAPAGRPDVHTTLTERYHPIITGIRLTGGGWFTASVTA